MNPQHLPESQSRTAVHIWRLTGIALILVGLLVFVYLLLVPVLHRMIPFHPPWIESILHSFLLSLLSFVIAFLLFHKHLKWLAQGFTCLWLPAAIASIALLSLPAQEREPGLFFLIYYLLIPIGLGNVLSWTAHYRKNLKKYARKKEKAQPDATASDVCPADSKTRSTEEKL